MPNRPSYKTIAEKAGVSQMTVSLAFRNSPSIRESTRERVLKAAEALGYRPDPEVNRLLNYIRDRQSQSVRSSLACLNFFQTRQAFVNSPFRNALWKGMQERAESLGYNIDLINLFEPELRPERLAGILEARSIQGVLLPTAPNPVDEERWLLPSVATVSTSYLFDALPVDRVHFNAHRMVRIAFEKSYASGHKRIGIALQPDQDTHSSGEWLAAFLRAQFTQKKKEQVPPLFKEKITDAFLKRWIRQHKPEVVIAPDNGLFQRIESLDLAEIPQFISLNWSRRAAHCAGISANPELIGSAAIDLLTAHVQRNESGIPENRKSVTVEPSWHDGRSFKVGAMHHA